MGTADDSCFAAKLNVELRPYVHNASGTEKTSTTVSNVGSSIMNAAATAMRSKRNEVRRALQLERLTETQHKEKQRSGMNTWAPNSVAGSSPVPSWNPPSNTPGSSRLGGRTASIASSQRSSMEYKISAFRNRFLMHS